MNKILPTSMLLDAMLLLMKMLPDAILLQEKVHTLPGHAAHDESAHFIDATLCHAVADEDATHLDAT